MDGSLPLGVRVKNELLSLIITGKIKPGDRLKEVQIAEQMNVSRLPVREALSLLIQEGFVESGPYKNNIVVGMNYDEVIHVYLPIRRTIELYALEIFLKVATEEHFIMMDFQIRNMEWAKEVGDMEKFVEADIKFHECMMEGSKLNNLMYMWSTISNKLRMYFFTSAQILNDQLDEVIDSHKKLLISMRAGNFIETKEKLLEHINEIVIT